LPSGGYVFTTLSGPGNTLFAQATGINDSGQVTGAYLDSSLHTHAFEWTAGQYVTLNYPGAFDTFGLGINAFGEIVGFYTQTEFGNQLGYQRSGGLYTAINYPGATATTPWGVNSLGQITGTYVDINNAQHGFLLSSSGQYTSVDAPNGVNGTGLYGVNDLGQTVGYYLDASFVGHGFLLQDGHFTPVSGPSGAHRSGPGGINLEGTIVGSFSDSSGLEHGYVESGGQYLRLDDPNGALGTTAWGINDLGQIVGTFTDANSVKHGFLATPSSGNPLRGLRLDHGILKTLESSGDIVRDALATDSRFNATGPVQEVTPTVGVPKAQDVGMVVAAMAGNPLPDAVVRSSEQGSTVRAAAKLSTGGGLGMSAQDVFSGPDEVWLYYLTQIGTL
jgi:probable HAF family extracellular repeat protein